MDGFFICLLRCIFAFRKQRQILKNKKWLLLLIIAFPSFFWLILESSTINSRKLPHYGPKSVAGTDTSYFTVRDSFTQKNDADAKSGFRISEKEFPLYAICFIDEKYRNDAYRLTGLWEYLNYKRNKIVHMPFFLVASPGNKDQSPYEDLKKLRQYSNVHLLESDSADFKDLVKTYFTQKPYYIDYSFFLLIDSQRNIRGYYDGRYVSEIKRLIEEYQHLRLKEEKKRMINDNEIESNS
jgi:hypothetical protein